MNSSEKNFAVLIDAENISPKYVEHIFEEMSNYGLVTYRRIYGDWTKQGSSKWKSILLDSSLLPMQQYSYTSGKNSSDSAMIIDAMDILYSGNVDGFCLVSSDSDFTKLASRLKESGMQVIGMGERKTPKPFAKACSVFKYLDVLYESDSLGDTDGQENLLALSTVEETIKKIISEYGDDYAGINIGELGSRLVKRHPDFDVRNFGYTKLSRFLTHFKSINLNKTDTSMTVSMKETEGSIDIEEALLQIVKSSKNKQINLGQLAKEISDRYPTFDLRSKGYSKFIKYIKDVPSLKVISSGKNGCVKTVTLR